MSCLSISRLDNPRIPPPSRHRRLRPFPGITRLEMVRGGEGLEVVRRTRRLSAIVFELVFRGLRSVFYSLHKTLKISEAFQPKRKCRKISSFQFTSSFKREGRCIQLGKSCAHAAESLRLERPSTSA